MDLKISDFQNFANTSWRDGRKLVVKNEGGRTSVGLGSFVFDPDKKTNSATMEAFRKALVSELGEIGEHAFDSLLGTRRQLGKGLRACDVKTVISNLARIRQNRFVGELNRQFFTSPKILGLSAADRQLVADAIKKDNFKGVDTQAFKSQDDVIAAARERLDAAIEEARATKEANGEGPLEQQKFNSCGKTETVVKSNEAMGLRIDTAVGSKSTSVEDRVKRGELGKGMVINLDSESKTMILDGLKSAGVEPGFNYRYDWSAKDTYGMMSDFHSAESVEELDDLLEKDPALAEKCKGKTLREQIMLAGNAHSSGMSAVAEFAICEAAKLLKNNALDEAANPFAKLAKAMQTYINNHPNLFKAGADDDFKIEGIANDPITYLADFAENGGDIKDTMGLLDTLKTELFTAIRDAVTHIPAKSEYNDLSPVFAGFSTKYVLKLDYNEGDRAVEWGSAHSGSFQRPERYLANHGSLMRYATSASADDISVGAVTEALANDLSRLAGVPTQDLQIVRGKYSDGHPKLMIASKYSEGYKDMKDGFFKDGRVVGENVESLGKYKAFFLLLGDRDAVGKYGQNKGIVSGKDGSGKFFAIDPGHSLEGNSQDLKVYDDLSFKDTAFTRHFDKRFANFSVFDDDTRFAKIKGFADLRAVWDSGEFKKLFDNYRKRFDPAEDNISSAEKNLRKKIIAQLDVKEAELNASYKKILKACKAPLDLYDSLKDDPKAQENAINAVSHLEMLTSPTKWTSKKGQVELKHLEIERDTRQRWTATVDEGGIVFQSDKSLDKKAWARLDAVRKMVVGGVTVRNREGGGVAIRVPKNSLDRFFEKFNEDYVQQITHPEEYKARQRGTGSKIVG